MARKQHYKDSGDGNTFKGSQQNEHITVPSSHIGASIPFKNATGAMCVKHRAKSPGRETQRGTTPRDQIPGMNTISVPAFSVRVLSLPKSIQLSPLKSIHSLSFVQSKFPTFLVSYLGF